jgi:hypothetical protein
MTHAYFEPGHDLHITPAPRTHVVSHVPMADGIESLTVHMDQLAATGWLPFHIHESILAGVPSFLVFSRKDS